jgi:hypothetical protein
MRLRIIAVFCYPDLDSGSFIFFYTMNTFLEYLYKQVRE